MARTEDKHQVAGLITASRLQRCSAVIRTSMHSPPTWTVRPTGYQVLARSM